MHITLTGNLGSGKSTISKIFANKYGYEIYSTGKVIREFAAERGLSVLEMNQLMEKDNSFDHLIDDRVRQVSIERKEDLFLDSRLAWHFAVDTFKVFLSVDITADDIAIDLNLQVNPLAHRSRVAHLTVLRLRAVATYLYGVLCIGPAANVPPRVVVFVLIVEDDEESLCSGVFAGTERHSVCRTFKRGVADASAALIVISAVCSLFLYSVANAP